MPNQYTIGISVKTKYAKEPSDPANAHYVFSYTITIKNKNPTPIKLLGKRWIITDANNHVQEIQETEIDDQQPLIQPYESFHYTSIAVLETPLGYMRGNYHLIAKEDGIEFDANVPAFSLYVPKLMH